MSKGCQPSTKEKGRGCRVPHRKGNLKNHMSQQQQNAADPVSEYLEKNPSVSAYLKDAISLLLECRPADPVGFLAEYFATPGASRSYRFLRLSRRARQTFWDHILAAYMALEPEAGAGVSFAEFSKLIKSVCSDFPSDVVPLVLSLHSHCEKQSNGRTPCSLTFHEFAAGANAALLCGTLLKQVNALFSSVDVTGTGSVPRGTILSMLQSCPATEECAEPGILSELCQALPPNQEMLQSDDIVGALFKVCNPYESASRKYPMEPAPHVGLTVPLWMNPRGKVSGIPRGPPPRSAFVAAPNHDGRYMLPS